MALQVEVGVLGRVGDKEGEGFLAIELLQEVSLRENKDVEGTFKLEVLILGRDGEMVAFTFELATILAWG